MDLAPGRWSSESRLDQTSWWVQITRLVAVGLGVPNVHPLSSQKQGWMLVVGMKFWYLLFSLQENVFPDEFEPGQQLWNVFSLNRQKQHGCWVCACWSYGMKARLACYGMNDWICLFYSMCFICSILRWFVMWPFPMSYTRFCWCYNSLLKWLKSSIVLSYWSPIVHVSEFGTLVLCMQDAILSGCSRKLSVQNNF